MRISIDSIGISQLKGTGLGSYTLEFLRYLLGIYPQPKYDLLYDKLIPNFNINKNSKASFLDLNINRKNNDYSHIENHIIENKVDIYHSINNGFSIPKNKKCPYIATVHDLLPVVNPSYVDDKYMEKFNMVFPNAMLNSDKIIVVSEFIKEQLRNYFDIPEKKILVNYPGCSKNFTAKNSESCENILSSKYKLRGDYILHVGSIHVRKNLEKLIRAFKYISLENKSLKLVLIGNYEGKRREYYEKLKLLIEELNLREAIVFMGTVDYNDMPYFYSKARCVINLSKYEGFPLSSIEAMACYTPVIWNDESFFREVFNDAGIKVDANDNDMLVDTILSVISNEGLREKILSKQPQITMKYKWEKNILNTIRVYESIV